MGKDRYKKVNDKWWFDTIEAKWIHNDRIDSHLFKEIDKEKGTKLGKEFKNTKYKKYY
jgi:hypothetical protein